MIILWDYIESEWRRTPAVVETSSGVIDSQAWATQGRWSELEAESIYEEWTSPDPAPLGYDEPIVELHDGRNKAARHPAGTQQERDAATRQYLEDEIENQRTASNQLQIDLADDPGLKVVMDESNAAAEVKLAELMQTEDSALGTFDSLIGIEQVGALATARSLINQEMAQLSNPALSAAEVTELETAMAVHQAVIAAGDDAAVVPAAPKSVRRYVGVTAEGYGILIARRVFNNPWWQLEFELRPKRERVRVEFPADQYWIAVYSDTAPDDGNDTTTGYLTTAQLTETQPGIYVANAAAVNLSSANTSTGYKITLCHMHLNNPQFSKVTFPPDVLWARYRARWGGDAG